MKKESSEKIKNETGLRFYSTYSTQHQNIKTSLITVTVQNQLLE